MQHTLTFSQAVEGYLLDAGARRLSSHTVADYTVTFRKFGHFLGNDWPLAGITADQVRAFLAGQPVSKKTVFNYHVGLGALWTWAIKENLVGTHIIHQVARPAPEQRAILPFTRADVEAMLQACDRGRSYVRPGKSECANRRPTALRDRAILMLLLDAGLRASELVELTLDRCDLKNRRVTVEGKGSKERGVPFSARTGQAIWRYTCARPTPRGNTTRVFLSESGTPLSRYALLRLISRLGTRAGVLDAHPHRFRHTFAVQFLRNGGNAFILQSLLGHSTMEMVRIYIQLAQHDLDSGHSRASPVDNWGL